MRGVISLVLVGLLALTVSAIHVEKSGIKFKGKNNYKFIEKFAFGEDTQSFVKFRIRFESPYTPGRDYEGAQLNMIYD